MNATEPKSATLEFTEGCPDEPGTYLFCMPKAHETKEAFGLLVALSDPSGHDWYMVDVFRDDATGWLLYVNPHDGETRVVRGDSPCMSVWFSRLPLD